MRHEVAPGRSVKVGYRLLCPGDSVDGILEPKEISRCLADGFVVQALDVAPAPPAPPEKVEGPEDMKEAAGSWALDPDGIRGRNLDDLNLLIVERNGTPVEEVEEAVSVLSKDFIPLKDN